MGIKEKQKIYFSVFSNFSQRFLLSRLIIYLISDNTGKSVRLTVYGASVGVKQGKRKGFK